MKALTFLVIAATATIIQVKAQDPSYNCPSTCTVATNCFCASKEIPGGLTPEQAPMFVTLTLDDAIQQRTYDAFTAAVQNAFKNPNGCTLPATYFMCNLYTDYWMGQRTYAEGNEIAGHTVTHSDMVNVSKTDEKALLAEMYMNWNSINILSGVPSDELVGFRHPFLSYSKKTYDALYKLKDYFKYESSITLDPITQGYWPHTLDYGMPYNPGNCVGCEKGSEWIYPGLWVVPMYTLLTNSDPPAVWSSMDILIDPAVNSTFDDAMKNLKASFLYHYDKRLPFGLYQHVAQYLAWPKDVQERKTKLMTEFVQWTQTFKNVWYVTNTQLLNWVKNPKPVNDVGDMFACFTSSSKEEVCDGVDNNGNGQIDEGLVSTCSYGNVNFQTCFGCPDRSPSIYNYVENLSGNRGPIPDQGCPNRSGPWDPVKKVCSGSGQPGGPRKIRTTIDLPSPTNGPESSGDPSKPSNVATITQRPSSASKTGIESYVWLFLVASGVYLSMMAF
ncbi:hypothetical protein HDU97_006113 [Phlyctochytrium planicorne]|nr:hypothetical protein HDU97_006113 [Phlyctochytrium planicorne]